ncbi:MAG: hypothetical protein ABH864_06440 [archaeon]
MTEQETYSIASAVRLVDDTLLEIEWSNAIYSVLWGRGIIGKSSAIPRDEGNVTVYRDQTSGGVVVTATKIRGSGMLIPLSFDLRNDGMEPEEFREVVGEIRRLRGAAA